MCGIVGCIGLDRAVEMVLGGLKKLEYRGYDSAGIATIVDKKLSITRVAGRVAALGEKLGDRDHASTMAIGHTRWATHGPPTEVNAHPHSDSKNTLCLVHNGIIENHHVLREQLAQKGFSFSSETDSEVAACLIASFYEGDLRAAVEQAIPHLEGAFAFAVISPNQPDLLVGARRGSPLAVGCGDGFFILASDAVPIVEHTRQVLYLEDDQVISLSANSLVLSKNGTPCQARPQEIRWNAEDAERGGFEHFMLKEIHEQPTALRNLAAHLIRDPGSETNPESLPTFCLDPEAFSADKLNTISRIIIVGQGTALHAGMVGRNMIERTARIPVAVEYGSDFRYRDPVLDPTVLVMAISQSGETADTLGAIRLAKDRGCPTVAVINTEGSSIARECDGVIYMRIGPEIGVASTKAFSGQIAALYVLAIHLGIVRGTLSAPDARRRVNDLRQVPFRVEEILDDQDAIRRIALKYKDASNALYLGRGTGYPLALEGALKLKEVSYIHAEGLDAGEMKHGPIALIDEQMPVVIIALKGRRYEKILANIQEVKARGGKIVAIASHDDDRIADLVDDVIPIPDDRGIMNALVCSVPLQLLAYYIALARGCDVDKPRNLAKSVTVE